jgi:hypothetical protein
MTLPFGLFINIDLFSGIAGLVFSLMIFSYVIGDNFLFRLALYIFTGVSAGYIASVAWWQVLLPKLVLPMVYGSTQESLLLAFPLVGILLILMKVSPRLAGAGRIAMAYLVGVGSAVTLAGALRGTLIPQLEGTVNSFDITTVPFAQIMLSSSFILLGTVFSLIYFHFGARSQPDGSMRRFGVIEFFAWIGRFFIGVTLGVMFAGVYAAALTALIERISTIVNFFGTLP